MTRGTLVLVVGPSGAGKDTLIRAARTACAADPSLVFAARIVTRNGGGAEGDAWASPAEFAALKASGGFLLDWSAHGIEYGVPLRHSEDLAAGRRVVANVSRTVIADAHLRLAPVRVIEITAPRAVRAERLHARGREDGAAIAGRLDRTVALPDGIPVARIVNDGALADAAARFLAALRGDN